MKFDCGDDNPPLTEKDYRDLKKWRAEHSAWCERNSYLLNWHKWFAWYPVRLDKHDCRWLETVERRGETDGINCNILDWFYR